METVDIAFLGPETTSSAERYPLSAHLETTHLALNQCRLPPGEDLPSGLHAHMDQEEVFVVTAGTVTFETLEGDVTVGEHEAIRFAPGEFQSGRNPADETAVVLAMGAPKESEDVRIPAACPACDHGQLRLDSDDSGMIFSCPACETTHIPAPCPACRADDLQVTLAESPATEVRCRECGATFDRPPVA